MEESESLILARKFLGQEVDVVIDRPLGSKHPEHGFIYEANYGYVPNTLAPDGEELDAYFLGVDRAVKEEKGRCIAIVHRLNDDDSKLVVVPEGVQMDDEEINEAIYFQEKWFEHELVKDKNNLSDKQYPDKAVHVKLNSPRFKRKREEDEDMVV